MTSPKHIAVILVLTAAILIAGCGSLVEVPGSSVETVSRDSGLSYGVPMPVPTFAPSSKVAAEQAAGGSNAVPGVEMKIIKTGQVTIEVAQVPAALDQVRDITIANGGYVSSSNVYTSQNDRKTGYVMIRVPAEKFEPVMQALAPLGKVLSTSTQRSDVTEEYLDLTIQNESYHNQLENYYRLMDTATEVEDIIRIQQQIDRITMSLNQIEGRLRYLDSQIDLSTITVNLQEPEPVGGEGGYNIVTAINEGIAAFFGMISVLIVLVFAFIPLIIVGLVLYVVYRWYRKRKGGSATLATPGPAETKA
ncbi:MAG: DUF4349 domain-containing protein [Methanomicrobiales archaeon]|nr:DUF4349 domain-containing protein [Methanomicrobiales archaeon]